MSIWNLFSATPDVLAMERARDLDGLTRALKYKVESPKPKAIAVRCDAARGLGALESAAALEALLSGLDDPVAEVREIVRAVLNRLTNKNLSEADWRRWLASPAAGGGKHFIRVHVFNPTMRSYSELWMIGRDVPRRIVDAHVDPESESLYAVQFYSAEKRGAPQKRYVGRKEWIAEKEANRFQEIIRTLRSSDPRAMIDAAGLLANPTLLKKSGVLGAAVNAFVESHKLRGSHEPKAAWLEVRRRLEAVLRSAAEDPALGQELSGLIGVLSGRLEITGEDWMERMDDWRASASNAAIRDAIAFLKPLCRQFEKE